MEGDRREGDRKRERYRERQREGERETEGEREIERDRGRKSQREKETEAERETQGKRDRESSTESSRGCTNRATDRAEIGRQRVTNWKRIFEGRVTFVNLPPSKSNQIK